MVDAYIRLLQFDESIAKRTLQNNLVEHKWVHKTGLMDLPSELNDSALSDSRHPQPRLPCPDGSALEDYNL